MSSVLAPFSRGALRLSRAAYGPAVAGVLSSAAPRRSVSSPPALWKSVHGIFDFETPMTEKMPGIPKATAMPAIPFSPAQITTLPSGLRVASSDAAGRVASVSLFVDAGSRYESSPALSGTSHLLEKLAFTSTATRSKFRMLRDIEASGLAVSAAASRECMAYSVEGMRGQVGAMAEIVVEAATRPALMNYAGGVVETDFARAELRADAAELGEAAAELMKDPNMVLMESVHAAAYGGSTLGLPLPAVKGKIEKIEPATVADYLSALYTADRMVVSGVNVDHDELVAAVTASAADVPRSSSLGFPKATYVGGEVRVPAAEVGAGSHVALAFEGVAWEDPDVIPVCVLNSLLGGGGSFSAGGPGKGMYTKLYTEVLNRHGWVQNVAAFNCIYSDSGLFGITASAGPGELAQLADLVVEQANNMAKGLSAEQVSRAKNMTASALVMHLESRSLMSEDIGRQVLSSGKHIPADELVQKIQAVSVKDLQRVASRMLASKPSLVLYGDLINTPTFQHVESSVVSKKLSQ